MAELRDPTLTEERYNKTIEKLLSGIDFHIKLSKDKGRLSIMGSMPRDYVRIGLGVYSKGGELKEVKTFFNKAIDLRIKLCEQTQSPFDAEDGGWSSFNDLIYVLPAAYFVDRVADIRKYFFAESFLNTKVKFTRNCAALCAQFILLMEKQSINTIKIDTITFNQANLKSWAPLLELFQAVSDKNKTLFSEYLQVYLKKDWSRFFNNSKKKMFQKDETLPYVGHYSLLAGVLCDIMGTVPALPKEIDFIFKV